MVDNKENNNSEMKEIDLKKYEDLNNLPTRKELLAMDRNIAKKIIDTARAVHTNKELTAALGMKSSNTLYSFLIKIGAEMRPRHGGRVSHKSKKADNNKVKEPVQNTKDVKKVYNNDAVNLKSYIDMFKSDLESTDSLEEIEEECKFKIIVNDSLKSEDIETKILGVLGALSKNKTYKISVTIEELND